MPVKRVTSSTLWKSLALDTCQVLVSEFLFFGEKTSVERHSLWRRENVDPL